MAEKLPHPTAVANPDRVGTDFIDVTQTRCADAAWHFKIGVHKSSKLGPEGEEQPTPDVPTRSLGLFQRDEPKSDVEVMGFLMPFEIDPLYWLQESMAAQEKTIVSEKSVMMRGGLLGDVVATWPGEKEGEEFAGRFFASKWGPRIFTICCRASKADYVALADDFFISIASFAAVDEKYGHFAEKVLTVRGETPFAWKVALPESWVLQPAPEGPRVSSFQAAQIPLEPLEDTETLAGKLSFAVVARSAVRVPRAAANAFLEVLKENEFEIEDKDFEEEPSRPPFHKSWLLVANTTRRDKPGELRCRVMLHERAWIIAGVIGPRREDAGFAWMRNTRVLDIVTTTVVMHP